MDNQRPRCSCGKAVYRTWSDAARDCRAIKRNNKRQRTLSVYWSRRCNCFHLGRR